MLNLTASREGQVISESIEFEDMPEHQLAPSLSYIGGTPSNAQVSVCLFWMKKVAGTFHCKYLVKNKQSPFWFYKGLQELLCVSDIFGSENQTEIFYDPQIRWCLPLVYFTPHESWVS